MQSSVAVFPTALGILLLVFFVLMFVAATVGTILFLAGPPRSGVRRVGRSLSLACGSAFCLLLLLAITLYGVRASQVEVRPAQRVVMEVSPVPMQPPRSPIQPA